MAVTSVTTTMAGAINYTVVTDTSADWASVANSTYFYDKADKLVHYKNSTGTILEVFSASGLTYFTEAQNTAAPNATVPVDSLTAVASTTDADFAIIPKGTGAIIADIPDGLVAGGNKRGQYAVDLQMARLTNASVASGNYSVISGGYYNTASNIQATVGGGYQNTASGPQSTIGGGQQNSATADFATVAGGASNSAGGRCVVAGGASNSASGYAAATLGGFGNTSTNNYTSNIGGLSNSASGEYSSVIGGASNVASGRYSLAGGVQSVANANYSTALGYGASVNGIIGRNAYCKLHAVVGDAQTSTFIFAQRTTDATLTSFTIDGTAPSTVNQIILPNNGAFRFKGTIIAKQSGSTNVAAWDIDGLIVRGVNAASTTLLISNVTLIQNTPGWGTPTLAADPTAGGLRIYILGGTATNIQWVADIKTTEVIYA